MQCPLGSLQLQFCGFFGSTGFELRALHLLGKHSIFYSFGFGGTGV
jgi:hypothetical protein